MNINDIILSIHKFFFEYYISTEFLGIYRIITCVTILSYLLYIHKDIWKFINPSGIFSYNFFYKNSLEIFKLNKLLFLFKYNSWSIILYFSLYIFGVLSLIGLMTNLSLICFFILLISFQHRVRPILQSGGDIIASFLLFNLILMQSGLSFSIDKYIYDYNIKYTYGWPLRLIQLTLSIGYLNSAYYKLKSKDWASGNALKNVLFYTLWSKQKFKKTPSNEIVFKISNYLTVVFQFLAPFFLWINELRPLTICVGILMHGIMILTLKIGYFGPIMIIAILSFAANYFQ